MESQVEAMLWLAVVVIAYFAPTFAAAKGRRLSVFVINFAFGLSVIGWFIALYLAFRSREQADAAAKAREAK